MSRPRHGGPSATGQPTVNDRVGFGAWLRREREARGLSIDRIARETKVGGALLAGLEQGDLSRWPAGIFRRSFVRAYAKAVGLDPAEVLGEFLRFYPDEGAPTPPVSRQATEATAPGPLRLTLAGGARGWRPEPTRLAGVAFDLTAAALLVALPALLVTAAYWGLALAGVLGYFVLGALLAGTSPGIWAAELVDRVRGRRLRREAVDRAARLDADTVRHLVAQGQPRPAPRRSRILVRGGRGARPAADPRVTRH